MSRRASGVAIGRPRPDLGGRRRRTEVAVDVTGIEDDPADREPYVAEATGGETATRWVDGSGEASGFYHFAHTDWRAMIGSFCTTSAESPRLDAGSLFGTRAVTDDVGVRDPRAR